MTRRLLGLVAVIALTVGLTPLAATPAAAAPCTDPFTGQFRAEVARRFPGQRVTAAVYDTRSDCWYHLARGMEITTASVIKAQFLAGVLLRAQDERRSIDAFERSRLEPTMSLSHNPPASDLFVSLGGVSGMEQLDRRFGLADTTHTTRWGATVSTAEARTRLALSMLHGGGPLDASSRALAWRFMTSVHPTQQWGISAGVPAGWTIALKNGFYPTTGSAAWRIGSTGFVRDDLTGGGYAITIQTDRNPDHSSGQSLVEYVATEVATVLTAGGRVPREVDRSRCVRTSGGEAWTSVAGRLGVPGDAAGVQSVSGGGSSALSGMRACAPTLGAATAGPGGSTVDGAYRPLAGDFDGDGTDDVFWYAPGPGDDYVWRGQSGGRFASDRRPINGSYVPLVGDFTGDDTDDIFWYAPGGTADYLWIGNPSGAFTSNRQQVNGSFQPLVGDFTGDDVDDIFWYAPGGTADYLWIGNPSGAFSSVGRPVNASYEPAVGDFDGDGRSDVLWYAPGGRSDYLWSGQTDGTFESDAIEINGTYLPVVADLDGDERDDVVWYAPGAPSDFRWRSTGDRGDFTTSAENLPDLYRPIVGDLDGDQATEIFFYGAGSHADVLFDGSNRRTLPVNGRYEPVTGDVDGDGRVDILWYGRGRATDHLWLGAADATAPRTVKPTA